MAADLRSWVRHSSYCYASEGRGGAPRPCICGLDEALAAPVDGLRTKLDRWMAEQPRTYNHAEGAAYGYDVARREVELILSGDWYGSDDPPIAREEADDDRS